MQQRPDGQPGICHVDDTGGWGEGAATPTGLCSDLRPGPTNGFWRDADWLRCRDDKWRPVEPGTFPLVNGAASRLVPLCSDCRERKTINENMLELRHRFNQDERRSKEEILLHGLLKSTQDFGTKNEKHRAPASEANNKGDSVQSVRGYGESTQSPQGQEPAKQRPSKFGGAVFDAPSQRTCNEHASFSVCGVREDIYSSIASEPQQDLQCGVLGCMGEDVRQTKVGSSRVTSLRAYGNAINAPAAQAFIECVMQ